MKKLLITFLVLIMATHPGTAQSAKKLSLISSKTEYLDTNDSIQHTAVEKTVIEISPETIVISPGHEPERAMRGKVTSSDYYWDKPFTDGRIRLNAVFVNREGVTKNGTITLTGVNGKIVFLLEDDNDQLIRVRVVAEKFEQKL